jgi:hypothetical protein
VKSGPDVFADALVPRAGTSRALRSGFSKFLKTIIRLPRRRGPGFFCACGRSAPTVTALSPGVTAGTGAIAAMVIVSRNRKVNRMSQTDETPVKGALPRFGSCRGRNLFTPDSSRYLNCPSNLIGHDHPNKPANGVG